ncbi:MAG TPA: divalent-cation tolerance protein CutA [Stellaceae bacterium]|jgi:periplasmic divalent cation tolerance protein|nr:divalent-cation tolerance protein CutA [Stellaceae bacterium]
MDASQGSGETPVFVYATASSVEEAKTIGSMVVAERLAACANILGGMMSIYRWDGGMAENMEAMLLLKTTRDRLDALKARVEALHSYEVPCIAVLPVESVSQGFGAWIVAETR